MPRRVLAVASGKGGVGKSTVAVGLALALRQKGFEVGLLDADLYGPDVPRMLGLTRTVDAKHVTVWSNPRAGGRPPPPVERYGIKVWSAQFLIGEGQPLALQANLASLLLRRAFSGVEWGEIDWLIVDLPPGTADLQQQLAGQLGLNGALMVVTPQDVAHLDAKKVHAMLDGLGVPVIGGVENMAPLSCPCCGETIELFPPTADSRTIWALGVPLLARIPFTSQVTRASELGAPLLAEAEAEAESDGAAAAFRALAAAVATRTV